MNDERIGGASTREEACPGCGDTFSCYRGGSWDYEKKYCDKCVSYLIEMDLEKLKTGHPEIWEMMQKKIKIWGIK